jgi:flagellar hook-basal body complex protein FliE
VTAVIPAIAPIAPFPSPPATGGATAPGTGDSFSGSITNALNQVQQTQNTASTAESQAAAGQGSVTNAMIDATQASLDTQVTVALVDKGVAAFTDIMNMSF